MRRRDIPRSRSAAGGGAQQRFSLAQEGGADRAEQLQTQLAGTRRCPATHHPRLQLEFATLRRQDPRQRGVLHESMAMASRRDSMTRGVVQRRVHEVGVSRPKEPAPGLDRLTGVTSRRKRMLDAMSANSRSIAKSLGRNSSGTVTPQCRQRVQGEPSGGGRECSRNSLT